MGAFCFFPFSCLAPLSLTPSPTSHWWISWKALTSASRCFSILHCCSPRLTWWAGSVFRSSCFSKVTAASYSPSVKSSGRNSPVSPLPFFFPVTCKGRRRQGQKYGGLSWALSLQRMLQEVSGPFSLVTATSMQRTVRSQAATRCSNVPGMTFRCLSCCLS